MQIREIKDFPNYILYIDGRVQNLKTKRFLKPCEDREGYLRIGLCKNNKVTKYSIARLIAEHFIGNPEKKPFVDHISGDRKDNSIENLRWCTSTENNRNLKCHRENDDVGVVWDKSNKKWKARIYNFSRNLYLGSFVNKEDAIKARKEAERKYWSSE